MNILNRLFGKEECTLCFNVPKEMSLNSHSEFKELVVLAKKWVREGVLVQAKKGMAQDFCLLSDIPNEPPWDDIIYTKLQCKECNSKYELFADTYHDGPNNRWRRI